LKPPSFIYAASRAEKPRKLAKFAPSSETWANDMLTIKGEKKVEKEQEEGDYYHSERSYQLRREVLQSFLTPNSARFHVRSDRTRTA
jgi:hypothetical protein